MTKEEFLNQTGLSEKKFSGEDPIEGSLDLNFLTSIPEGFSPTVGGNLYLDSLKSIPKGFSPTVGGNLYLDSLKSIPKGFSPTVGGDLYLDSLKSIPKGFNPTVGGYLDLCSVTSIPEGFNPTVGEGLYLKSITSIPEGFNPTVGGGLFLGSVTSIPKGFSPTVGGDLYLDSLKSIPEGFNPTVGGGLYLKSITSIPKGFSPTVGRDVYLPKGMSCHKKNLPSGAFNFLSWQDGKYIKVDGIFCEVLSKRKGVFKCKKVGPNQGPFYVVTDGEGTYSHGKTIKEAREDLVYKLTSNTDKEKYKGISRKEKLSFKEAIGAYRAITGACFFGVKDFCERKNISKRKKYSIGDVIELTKGEYGHQKFVEWVG